MATPVSSLSDANSPLLEEISNAIRTAVNHDPESEWHEKFMPAAQLHKILKEERLSELFSYLLGTSKWRRRSAEPGESRPHHIGGTRAHGDHRHLSLIQQCVKATLSPSRISLLALFLYDRGTSCLELFVDSIINPNVEPSFARDEDLPFDQTSVRTAFPNENDRQYILQHQGMFAQFVFKEHEYKTLDLARYRKPFVSPSEELKKGGFSTVYKVTIPAGQYEYIHAGSIERSRESKTFALKTFPPSPQGHQAYGNEKEFLDGLRQNNNLNKMIQLDLGGIIMKDLSGRVEPSLLFELAACDLQDLFKSKDFFRDFQTKKNLLIDNAVDIMEALSFLHKTVRSLHLDIKPNNILVFRRPNSDLLAWKISDFNLSQKKVQKKDDGYLELSYTGSYASTLPSARTAGLYQAPEIQDTDAETDQINVASEASDMWSMGCLLLKLIAFLCNGPDEVFDLENRLEVHTRDPSGSRKFFYVSTSLYEWVAEPHPLEFLDAPGFMPMKGVLPDGTEAMVHPGACQWAEQMYQDASPGNEQDALMKAFKLIFARILLIDRKARISADVAAKKLKKVGSAYQVPSSPSARMLSHSEACSRVRAMNTKEKDVMEIIGDSELAPKQCPKCSSYLIHQLLRWRYYTALRSHAEKLSYDDVNAESLEDRQTPISIACENRGDADALKVLFDCHRPRIQIPQIIYSRRKGMQRAARRIVEDWYEKPSGSSLSTQQSQSTTSTGRSNSSFPSLSRWRHGS